MKILICTLNVLYQTSKYVCIIWMLVIKIYLKHSYYNCLSLYLGNYQPGEQACTYITIMLPIITCASQHATLNTIYCSAVAVQAL